MEPITENNEEKWFSIKYIVITALIICLIGAIIGSFFVEPLKWCLGMLLGYVTALITFRLLYLQTKMLLESGSSNLKFKGLANYTSRYLIKGAMLYISIIKPYLCMASCAIGILSINMAIHVLNILNIFFAKSKGRE